MAECIVAKKMSTIALAGGRAFFVPACWPYLRGNIMATENVQTEFESIQDCPQFLRERIAQHLGETVEWVTSRIDSGDAAGLELIEECILTIGVHAKALG